MTEYDYINDETGAEEKKQLVRHMIGQEMQNLADSRYADPKFAGALESSNFECL